ncbi:MAG TPA: FAD-binding oxidoreductase [Bryobacteraceae bacterium]|nr:FAD-binding oxidoreductase [Bryobacteraceae bacterium]
MIKEAALKDLRASVRGAVLTPTDAGYDEVRRIHNGMFVRRPALIVRCLGTADVADAVRFARAQNLELAVRGGGHSVAGKSVCEGGLMLDLSLMKGIHVDPAGRTVRAQGGVTWGEFNRETQLHGLATTGGVVSTTGIAGLTLGGGLGWLMGKHGLAADNLISAEVVTAAGDVVRASAQGDRDLFWGLRGGGGNFGVVSWFEYRLHPIGPVTSGLVAHPIERAREVLRFFRQVTSSVPDELTLSGGLLHAPDGSGVPLAVIVGCHCGSLAEGEAAMRPIKRFASPVADTIAPTSYVDTNATIFDPGFPRGARNYWKSSFLAELSDPAIEALIAQFAICPSPISGLVLEHFHGAAARVGVRETAFPHRRESYNLLVVSQWLDPKDDEKNIAWARATYDTLRPYMVRESYVNYQTEEESGNALEQVYGLNYERLVTLKNKLDPTNFFHLNNNVRPTV